MILIDGQPAVQTAYSDSSYPLFEYERTDKTTTAGDYFKYYWLGYMKYDNIPTSFLTSEFNISDHTISASIINIKTNSPIGFTTDNYGYDLYQQGYIKESGFTPVNNYLCYLNNIDVPSYNSQFNFATGASNACQLSILIETGADENLGTHNAIVSHILSADDATPGGLVNFLIGDRDMTLTRTLNGATITHTLKSTDLEENGLVEFTGIANGLYYKMSVFISGYGFKPLAGVDSSNHQRTYHIIPCVKMYSEYGNYYACRSDGSYYPNNTYFIINTGQFIYTSNPFNMPSIGLMGGYQFTFSRDALNALELYDFIYNENVIAYKSAAQIAQLYRVYKPSDLIHHFALMMRIAGTASHGYSVGIYCPEVLDDGEFTGNLLTGNLTEDDVQPWQWGNIQENEFTEDDIPPYVPPVPGEDEDGDGDTILPPSISGVGDLSGFVTMYALTDDQLAALGNTLWSSYTDSNFWNSISVVLTNTTSIDPSVILNYIVSIRLFPFNLATVDGASAELPEIFFGRGLVGLLLDSSLSSHAYVLNKCVTRIDGGVLDVPAKYGDFRDMEPCAKMILHVPFAGSCEINPSQVVGKHLALSYSIDYCTGALMAQCFVGGDGLGMSYPVATLYGQLGATVQLSASNEMEALQCLAGASMSVASGLMGNVSGMMSGAVGVATSLANNRTIPHTTGKSAGFSSFFEPRVPYIEIIYDKYYVPDNYAHVHGYACNTTSKIGDLHGYTVCRNVDTTGLSCETDERLSIKRILESGFFVD